MFFLETEHDNILWAKIVSSAIPFKNYQPIARYQSCVCPFVVLCCLWRHGKILRFSLDHYLENSTSYSTKIVPMWSPFNSNEIERFDKCGWPIWNQMRWYWEEGADALVGAHFQSSSNSSLVKDPERDHVAATEHYLDNLSTYFTPIRPIPLSSLRPQPPQKNLL